MTGWRAFTVYRRLLGEQLRAAMEHRVDFLLLVVSASLTQILSIVFLLTIFLHVSTVRGWTFWELAFLSAVVSLTEGVASVLAEGAWLLSSHVHHGGIDRFLVRPVPVVLQLLGSAVGPHGFGNIVLGLVVMGLAVAHAPLAWSLAKIAMLVVLLGSAVALRVAVTLASSSLVFWTGSARNAVPFLFHSVSELAKYPLTAYPKLLQVCLTAILPFAFVSFFPAAFVFDKQPWSPYALLSPIVALAALGVALKVFSRGLRRYEGTGG
jgi:ABC-2 type transport system permease protein